VAGDSDETSYARRLASPDHWDLRVTSVIIHSGPKEISSSAGHRAAWTSPFFPARLEALPQTLSAVREALLARDFGALALTVEREAVSMHAVAMTGRLAGSDWLSGLYYWTPGTLRLIHAVQAWRKAGLGVCFTIDAGPNLHLLCQAGDQPELARELAPLLSELGATTIVSHPGRGAWLVDQ
jgi:diphosphomevalonate decarboxylase